MRAPLLDQLRGLAVLLMVVFHAHYDLMLLGEVDTNFQRGFWFYFPRLIVFIFLWCVGAAMQLGHGERFAARTFLKRQGKLWGLALLISAASYLYAPQNWIYFGTLHCIAAASLLALPFVNRPRWALGVAALIVVLQFGAGLDIAWVSSRIQRPSLDFIPVYPWVWVTLLGIATGPRVLGWRWPFKLSWLALLGRRSLPIYLLHQPLIFALLWGWQRLRG